MTRTPLTRSEGSHLKRFQDQRAELCYGHHVDISSERLRNKNGSLRLRERGSGNHHREKTASIHFIAANYKVEIQPVENLEMESKGEKKTGGESNAPATPFCLIS